MDCFVPLSKLLNCMCSHVSEDHFRVNTALHILMKLLKYSLTTIIISKNSSSFKNLK